MKPGPLSPPLGNLAGVPIVESRLVPAGRYYTTWRLGQLVMLCHPDQVVRLEAGLDAVRIVHEGLADVLEWLGDAYPPKREPLNRPMPRRHIEPMLERVRKIAAQLSDELSETTGRPLSVAFDERPILPSAPLELKRAGVDGLVRQVADDLREARRRATS